MDFVYVNLTLHGSKGSREIKALVDTGSLYIVLPTRLINELGLHETPYTVELTLADGRRIKSRLYMVEVEVRGRRGPALVIGLDTPVPLLGIYALEILGFKVNPLTGELEEVSPPGGYLLNIVEVN